MIEIKVPTIGESINEVTLLKWAKNDGDYVEGDEVIAELESEKATYETNAKQAGMLKISTKERDTLKIGDVLTSIDEKAAKPGGNASPVAAEKKEVKKKEKTKVKAEVEDRVEVGAAAETS